MLRALPVALVLSVAAVAAASGSRVALVTGEYTSNWDDVSLVQTGTRVSGQYVCCGGGTIEGTVIEGRVLRFKWSEPRGAGEGMGVWVIKKDGTLEGTWGSGPSDNNGGPWTLSRKSAKQTIAN
jgi:hypothetical protein